MESLGILLAIGHNVSKERTWDQELGRTFKVVLGWRANKR